MPSIFSQRSRNSFVGIAVGVNDEGCLKSNRTLTAFKISIEMGIQIGQIG